MSHECCENCGRKIGALETPHLFEDHVVCAECSQRLTPTIDYATPASVTPFAPPTASVAQSAAPADAYRALGLETRGAAWGIAIIGLLLSPALIGIPLAVWGLVADSMLAKHQKSERPRHRESRTMPSSQLNASRESVGAVVGIFLILFLLVVAAFISQQFHG